MFQCKGCRAKDREIEYLRKLIDRLLEKLNVAPVAEQEKLQENFVEEEQEEGVEVVG